MSMAVQNGLDSHTVADKTATGAEGLARMRSWMTETLKAQEAHLHEGREAFTDVNGAERGVPDAVRDYFDGLRKRSTSPVDIQRIDEMERRVERSQRIQAEYFTSKVEGVGRRMHVEFGLNAIKKTTSGVQQLLSSQ